MNALGLAMIGADSFNKETQAGVERQRNADRYAAEKQRTDSELSLVGDATEARRTGLRLQNAQAQAGIDALPGETALKISRTKLDQGDVSGQLATQPTRNATRETQAKIDQATADFNYKDLPRKLSMAATQGQIDARGQADVVLGTLGSLIQRGDKASALDFSNKIANSTDILPGTNGMRFTDVQPERKGVNGGEDDGYRFFLDDGTSKLVPASALTAAMGKLKSGEYSFIHTADGSVFSGDKKTGRVTQQFQGDISKVPGGKQNTPAEIQSAEWLMKNGVAKDPTQAWGMVRSAREKTRGSFIADMLKDRITMNEKAESISQKQKIFGDLYDQIQREQGATPGLPTPSAPATGTTLPPGLDASRARINSLLGIGNE